MSFFKSIFTAAIILGAFMTMVSTAVYAASWDKMNDAESYGLPHVAQVHMDKGQPQLDHGSDGYGLPHVTGWHDSKMAFEKVDFGGDLYGLPYAGSFHKK
ncbi:MAG: hypothetical protein OEZ04_05130 [Nitrospinota bacterium]|nr:hypothetical protein [Nitrospinota bacterium]